jgi:DNA-directed RNA polymerase subunit RPC12/RpoP
MADSRPSQQGSREFTATKQRGDGMLDVTFINLTEAYLCSDCEAVGNSAVRCPRCQSNALIAITRAIPRHRDCIRLLCVPHEEQAA